MLPLALVLSGAAHAAVTGPCDDWKARRLLLQSMQKGRSVNVSAIVVQNESFGKVQFKLEQSDGLERHTILQPLSMQGVLSVDDGKRWMTYWPDERRALSQESPRKRLADPEERVKLADANYRLTIGEEATIAGRRALCVSAESRYRQMPDRRFYIDSETSFLLRADRIDADGGVLSLLDTKAISFPDSIPKCELFSKGSVRVIERDPPVPIRRGMNVREMVGFEPVLPSSLPFGFVIHEPQIVGGESRRFIAIRITDGLVNATVYQWDGKRDGSRRRDSERVVEAEGIRFRVAGDLSEEAKRQVLGRFVREAARVLGLVSELPALRALLNREGQIQLEIWIGTGQVTTE